MTTAKALDFAAMTETPLRIEIGTAWSVSNGLSPLRVVSIYRHEYTPTGRDKWIPVVRNLSIKGGDESNASLLTRLADLLEAGS